MGFRGLKTILNVCVELANHDFIGYLDVNIQFERAVRQNLSSTCNDFVPLPLKFFSWGMGKQALATCISPAVCVS